MRTAYDEATTVEQLHHPDTARAAFSRVIEHYSSQLYWHIRRLVINHDDANDVLQNTFIKAWTNIDSFRGDAQLMTWLYKIATNESLTLLNRNRVRMGISLDEEGNETLVADLESDRWFNGDEVQLRLQQAIATLPEKQRVVFNMRYYDEMKYEQMSEILGTSVGALKASYHHAVKKIEAFFEQAD